MNAYPPGTALHDLRALLSMTKDNAERERLTALMNTLVTRGKSLDSSFTPGLVHVLKRETERQQQKGRSA